MKMQILPRHRLIDGLLTLPAVMLYIWFLSAIGLPDWLLAIPAGLILLGLSIWQDLRYRAIKAIAVTPIAESKTGFVAVCGATRSLTDRPILSPLAAQPCCWFSLIKNAPGFFVRAMSRLPGSGRMGSGAAMIERESSALPFLVSDNSGTLIVNPRFAEFIAPYVTRKWKGKGWSMEKRIAENTMVYVMGHLYIRSENQLLADVSTHPLAARQLSLAATEACAQPPAIDKHRVAEARLPAAGSPSTSPAGLADLRVLACPRDGNRFIISCYHPYEMMTVHRQRSILLLGGAILMLYWGLRSIS